MNRLNRSAAVMAQRKEPRQSLDDFPTPPWATRALIEHVLKPMKLYDRKDVVWEPAANRGYMVRTLEEYYPVVHASDVADYGQGYVLHDFVMPFARAPFNADVIITNPPFTLAQQFIENALGIAERFVCIFGRIQLLEGKARWEAINRNNLFIVAPFVERVPLVKGRLDPNASSAVMYAWFVYQQNPPANPLCRMIPPCRHELEEERDYG